MYVLSNEVTDTSQLMKHEKMEIQQQEMAVTTVLKKLAGHVPPQMAKLVLVMVYEEMGEKLAQKFVMMVILVTPQAEELIAQEISMDGTEVEAHLLHPVYVLNNAEMATLLQVKNEKMAIPHQVTGASTVQKSQAGLAPQQTAKHLHAQKYEEMV